MKSNEEIEWLTRYMFYVASVHPIIDGEACGYADGDEEYEENFKKTT